MTSLYDVTFTRYKDHSRRQSGVVGLAARDFDDAVGQANIYLRGAREADPGADFEIASVALSRLGGKDAVSGWILPEELAEELVHDGPEHGKTEAR